MTDLERKIEAALDAYFKSESWSLDTQEGDHLATQIVADDQLSDGEEVVVNTTECAKRIAAELAPC